MFLNSASAPRGLSATTCIAGILAVATSPAWSAEQRPVVVQRADGRIQAGELLFDTWQQYAASDFFHEHGMRCGLSDRAVRGGAAASPPSDCSFSNTNPASEYAPVMGRYRIPIVVHIIENSTGSQGHISEAMVQGQIDILNEDFRAIVGTNGGDGTDVQIEFFLAQVDPLGNPTNGITYSNNTTWFNDSGSYWESLAWDTSRYLNIYTNTASGNLGYVPTLPQSGIAGHPSDRVVVLWSAFGRDAPIGPPYNQGRTATHEVGHYLGLAHTFSGGCASASNCYNNGDLICDTNPESQPAFGCPNRTTCGALDPVDNYMDYTDDLCMERFTPEQSRRMRCSLEHYRADVYQSVGCGTGAGEPCGPKSRYLSFQVPSGPYWESDVGIRVTVVDAPAFPQANGRTYWVGPPGVYPEDAINGAFVGSKLSCEPYVSEWSTFAIIHVTGPAVVPDSMYQLHFGTADCIDSGEEACLVEFATRTTLPWGDVAAPYGGTAQPDFTDIGSVVAKFKSLPTAPLKSQAQLQPNDPDPALNIGFSDIGQCVNGFKRLPYPFAGPPTCP